MGLFNGTGSLLRTGYIVCMQCAFYLTPPYYLLRRCSNLRIHVASFCPLGVRCADWAGCGHLAEVDPKTLKLPGELGCTLAHLSAIR